MTILKQVDDAAVADHLLEEWFEKVKHQNIVNFSTMLQLDYFRMKVVTEDEVSIEKIVTYKGTVVEVEAGAYPVKWPDELNYLSPILATLGKARRKRKGSKLCQ